MPRHRSSAVPLAWLYAALILYASLYPFSGWRESGVGWLDFLLLLPSRYWSGFDVAANLIGYLPFGFLAFLGGVRSGRSPAGSAWLAVALGAVLSFVLELLQNALPQRVATNVDLALNTGGATLGVGVGLLLHGRGGVERWQRIRERWFVARSAGGTALLLSWPIGLLFPTAVPFGLGHVLERVGGVIAEALRGTAVEGWTAGWFGAGVGFATAASSATAVAAVPPPTAAPATELAIVVLGLLAPCLVAITIAVPGWRRAAIVVGAVVVGCATTTLSTALNFGPEHALSWTTPLALQGVGVGMVAAALLSLVPGRVAAGLGLIVITALVMLVAQAPADPYFAQSLQDWEQGRFIRFHGAAQWVGWAWPYAALTYLLARLAMRDPEVGVDRVPERSLESRR